MRELLLEHADFEKLILNIEPQIKNKYENIRKSVRTILLTLGMANVSKNNFLRNLVTEEFFAFLKLSKDADNIKIIEYIDIENNLIDGWKQDSKIKLEKIYKNQLKTILREAKDINGEEIDNRKYYVFNTFSQKVDEYFDEYLQNSNIHFGINEGKTNLPLLSSSDKKNVQNLKNKYDKEKGKIFEKKTLEDAKISNKDLDNPTIIMNVLEKVCPDRNYLEHLNYIEEINLKYNLNLNNLTERVKKLNVIHSFYMKILEKINSFYIQIIKEKEQKVAELENALPTKISILINNETIKSIQKENNTSYQIACALLRKQIFNEISLTLDEKEILKAFFKEFNELFILTNQFNTIKRHLNSNESDFFGKGLLHERSLFYSHFDPSNFIDSHYYSIKQLLLKGIHTLNHTFFEYKDEREKIYREFILENNYKYGMNVYEYKQLLYDEDEEFEDEEFEDEEFEDEEFDD